MKPYLADPDFTLYVGSAVKVLRELDEASVDCVITSPPYWGLRDYDEPEQIGLEEDPRDYIDKLVEVFADVWRVLAPWGTVWLNMGDSFASKARGSDLGWEKSRLTNPGTVQKAQAASLRRDGQRHRGKRFGLKEKDLVMMPHRVAMALQEWGWWVRMDNVWSKRNALPESARDRPTYAHEYIFMLARSAKPLYWTHPFRKVLVSRKPKPDYWWLPPPGGEGRPLRDEFVNDEERADLEEREWRKTNIWEGHDYYFDQEGSRESADWARWGDQTVPKYEGTETATGWMQPRSKDELRRMRSGNLERKHGNDVGSPGGQHGDRGRSVPWEFDGRGRNMRSVWDIPTQPYPEAHFATFPERLVQKALIAGCPERVCRTCGKPAERILEVVYENPGNRTTNGPRSVERKHLEHGTAGYDQRLERRSETAGWTDCGHNDWRQGIVMDPFMGSGTVALVARNHGRHSVGIELSEKFAAMSAERLAQLSLLTV